MKKLLLNSICMLVLSAGGSRLHATELALAETNYQTCMNYCMGDSCGFTYCQGECKSLANTN